ncbi:phage head spike fiber domain-containing protein [Comamonas thiooxydans]|uniref:phage head spike fiber domain-containing protein n=1 Tax=Comamonas thiooxydans TaxID=363952 RepID=UPI0001BB11F3|nr:hypothetical protein [Comamonas thiooxydans]ACY33384.1 hypothetical protein CtCNB1_2638 [Comamonas thiooxydans]MDO1476055.1 hypothetical protein [Comamonas thiooxydans]
MANILNLPDLRPSLLLDFANSRQVDPRVTFTRASAATRWNAAGVLETVPAGVPRINYDPATGKCLGLLVEGARTNLVANNGTAGAVVGVLGSGGSLPTGWSAPTSNGLTCEVLSVGSEDGVPYVDVRFSGTATTNYQGLVFGNVSGYAPSTTYTATVYAKLLNGSIPASGTVQFKVRYNHSTGSTDINGAFSNASFVTDKLRVNRLPTTGATSSTSTGAGQLLMVFNYSVGTVIDFSLRIGLPQLEAGGAATMPILTTGSAATRADEFAGLFGANFSSWYRPDEGTFLFEGAPSSIATGPGPGLFAVGDATLSFETRNGLYLNSVSGTGVLAASLAVAGASQIGTNTVTGTFAAGVSKKTAFAYQTDNTVGATDGVLGVVDTLCTIPKGVTGLSLGELSAGWSGGTSRLNGHIRRFAFYPKRLTAAELKRITEA